MDVSIYLALILSNHHLYLDFDSILIQVDRKEPVRAKTDVALRAEKIVLLNRTG